MGEKIDLSSIEKMLTSGESLKIKYRYPLETSDENSSQDYGVRSDKLLDVDTERKRLFAKFKNKEPIWLCLEEVIEILPDDGKYEDFPI